MKRAWWFGVGCWVAWVGCSGRGGEGDGQGVGGRDTGDADASRGEDAGVRGDGGEGDARGDGGDGGGDGEDGGGGRDGGGGEVGACGNAGGQIFPPGAAWNEDISGRALDGESGAIIGYLAREHMAGARFQVDFSFRLLRAGEGTPVRRFEPTEDFYTPDCDPDPVPVPEGGALEGEAGYACASDGDCHLLVLDEARCRLHEVWRANITDEGFFGGCQAVWDTSRVYPEEGRGQDCTSADAAGLPIAPLLFTPEEVARGEIKHALRFILPNALMRELVYVRPATHSTRATGGPREAPPYGARLRLKAGVDVSGLSPGAQVVARALKRYGMILADGGNLTFTGLSDVGTGYSWEALGLGPHDLKPLQWTDFEVVELGERFVWEGNCVREGR